MRVDEINVIQGTDREFDLQVTVKSTGEPKDLQAFVGQTGNLLELKLPGTDGTITLDLDDDTEGKIEVLTVSSGLAGKVRVTLKDAGTAALREGDRQDMELVIREGAGPDFDISKVQYARQLNVKPMLFS